MFIERPNAHRADTFIDQIADRVIDHRGGDAGRQSKAIGQVGGDVELAAADVDQALGGFAEWNDSGVEAMNDGAERKKSRLPLDGMLRPVEGMPVRCVICRVSC